MQKTPSTLTLTATDLANHLSCRHLTHLKLQKEYGLLARPNRDDHRIKRLSELGDEHERNYIEHLRATGLSVLDWVEDKDIPYRDRTKPSFERTVDAMRNGIDVIVQARLKSDRWHGYADVLLKTDRKSDLGNWSYEVVDAKLTSETKGGTILQLCLYSEIVGKLQGDGGDPRNRYPEHMYVVSPSADFSREPFRFDDYSAYYRLVKRRLEDAVGAFQDVADDVSSREALLASTYPLPVPHCDVCRWWSLCKKRREDDDHLSLVANCGRLQTKELESKDVSTLEALATLPIVDNRLPFKPDRGSAQTFVGLHRQARLQHLERTLKSLQWEHRDDVQVGEGLHRLPEPDPGDIFFDIEGDRFVGDNGLEYLFGFALLAQGSGSNGSSPYHYESMWAVTPGSSVVSEKHLFEQFIDRVVELRRQNPNLHIYHYNHYEPDALKHLMTRYATREDAVDDLLRGHVFVDLYSVVRQAIRAGVESYSIKNLEKYYGFVRQVHLRDEASPALHAFERALEMGHVDRVNKETFDLVEGYNKDDCLSTACLRDWLEQLRAELLSDGAAIQRPSPDSDEATKVTERLAEIRSVADALRARLPADEADWSESDRSTAMLANMLEWYRREDKVSYWEKFRLQDLDDDELLDEREAIAYLEYMRTDPPPPKKRTPTDVFRFPVQETALKDDDDVFVAGGENQFEKLGTILWIDHEKSLVGIKKTNASLTWRPRSVYSWALIGRKGQEDTVLDIARLIAEVGIDSIDGRDAVARKLLLRRPPQTLSSADLEDEDSARQIVLNLDRDVLAIQGPPGSGKTYTGAQMICDLVAGGKRVGVTATSHEVVSGLLKKTLEIATERGLTIGCIHKQKRGSDRKCENDGSVCEEPKTPDVLKAVNTGTYQVIGGVSWFWVSKDVVGDGEYVDVLFVDEAGQMSLPEVLAVTRAAKNLVLLGDPAQLDQPKKASHPDGTDLSALEYFRGDAKTMPPERGLFIEETRRLHPDICSFTSELFYDGRLQHHSWTESHTLSGHPEVRGTGLYYVPVSHDGCQNESAEEAEVVCKLVQSLLGGTTRWTSHVEVEGPVRVEDILVVAPFNAQVERLKRCLPDGVRVGTVDKFQGKEAPIVIYSLTSSSAEEAPRGMDFLFNLNRLNVATSRAQCACVVVCSPRLLEPECRTPKQMKLANALARYAELADKIGGT